MVAQLFENMLIDLWCGYVPDKPIVIWKYHVTKARNAPNILNIAA